MIRHKSINYLCLLTLSIIPKLISSSHYSTESWLIDASFFQTPNETVWNLKVTSTDTRKTCNIIAQGAQPKLVALPMSTKSEILTIIPAQEKIDHSENSCYFEFEINVLPEKYRKIEIVIEELILENINTRVKHLRLQLPNYAENE